jgi:hypothetical protein
MRQVSPPADEIERMNRQFMDEAARYDLLYRCQDCVHVRGDTLRCSLGYPNEALVRSEGRALDDEGEFLFCKDFELDD